MNFTNKILSFFQKGDVVQSNSSISHKEASDYCIDSVGKCCNCKYFKQGYKEKDICDSPLWVAPVKSTDYCFQYVKKGGQSETIRSDYKS